MEDEVMSTELELCLKMDSSDARKIQKLKQCIPDYTDLDLYGPSSRVLWKSNGFDTGYQKDEY